MDTVVGVGIVAVAEADDAVVAFCTSCTEFIFDNKGRTAAGGSCLVSTDIERTIVADELEDAATLGVAGRLGGEGRSDKVEMVL